MDCLWPIRGRWGLALLGGALACVLANPLHAATTGKIHGRVTDQASGEPIPGAAVMIEGMRLGGSTDADGLYFIIGVPPGTYSVAASLVGYAPVTKAGVVVNIDRTTPVDFQLQASAIEVQGVTVVALREVIKLDVGGSRAMLESKDVMALPTLNSLSAAISREPGVGSNGTVRGGLYEETQLVLDGHTMTDSRLNMAYSQNTIPITSIQEVQVLKSGFNAEYGNIRSGVINVVTRDDPRRHWLSARTVYAPPQKPHWTVDARGNPTAPPYGEKSKEWQIFGSPASIKTLYKIPNLITPNPTDSITVFRSWYGYTIPSRPEAERLATAERFRQYWLHRHSFTEKDYANKPTYSIDATVGGPVPGIDGMSVTYSHRSSYAPYALVSARTAFKDYTEQATLTYRLGPAKLAVTGSYTSESGVGQPTQVGVSGAGTAPLITRGGWGPYETSLYKYALYRGTPIDNRYLLGGVTFTHALSPSTQYELSFDIQHNNYAMSMWPMRFSSISPTTVVNPLFEEHTFLAHLLAAGLDTTGASAGFRDILSSNRPDPKGVAPWGHQGLVLEFLDEIDGRSGFRYDLGAALDGTDSSYYTGYKLRGFLLSQITPHNQVKTGFEFTLDDFTNREHYGTLKSDTWVWWHRKPVSMSAYVQDKVEYEGMILNAGLRVDRYNPEANVYDAADPFSRVWEKTRWPYQINHDLYSWLDTSAVKDKHTITTARARTHFAPRLMISHPISAQSKVFFNYGHFYTYPRTAEVHSYRFSAEGTGVDPIPNPELDFPRTIAYELGLERQFSNALYAWIFGWEPEPQYLVSVAGYYKDVTREIGIISYYLTFTDAFSHPINKRYAQIRGVEGRLQKSVGNFVTGWIQGDLSLRDEGAVGLVRTDVDHLKDAPEAAYQLTSLAEPVWSLYVDLHTPRKFSPFGIPAPVGELWSLAYTMSYQKGALSTYNPALIEPPPPPNVRSRDSWGSSLTLSKGFSFGQKLVGQVSLSVSNVLGYKSLWSGGFVLLEWNDYLKSLHFPITDKAIEDTPGHDRIGDYPSYAVIPTHDSWATFLNPRTYTLALNLSFN